MVVRLREAGESSPITALGISEELIQGNASILHFLITK